MALKPIKIKLDDDEWAVTPRRASMNQIIAIAEVDEMPEDVKQVIALRDAVDAITVKCEQNGEVRESGDMPPEVIEEFILKHPSFRRAVKQEKAA